MNLRQYHPALGDLETFVKDNKKLVLKSAARYARLTGVEYDDLVAEGTIGLMVAFDRFDEKKGFLFSSFGVRYINGYILVYIRENGRQIRVPTHVFDAANKIFKRKMMDESPEEIAKKLNIPVGRAKEALAHASQKRLTSLSCPVDDSDFTIGDLIQIGSDFTGCKVSEFISSLTTKEQEVTELLNLGFTRKEIAKMLGVSYQSIHKRVEGVKRKAKAHFSLN